MTGLRRHVAAAAAIAAILALAIAPAAQAGVEWTKRISRTFQQDGGPVVDLPTVDGLPNLAPQADMLLGVAGVALITWIIMQSLVRPNLAAAVFDQRGGTIAVLVGIVLAVVASVVLAPITGAAILTAALVGLVGGYLSQNVNAQMTRLIGPRPPA